MWIFLLLQIISLILAGLEPPVRCMLGSETFLPDSIEVVGTGNACPH